jgi:hypothetical protein
VPCTHACACATTRDENYSDNYISVSVCLPTIFKLIIKQSLSYFNTLLTRFRRTYGTQEYNKLYIYVSKLTVKTHYISVSCLLLDHNNSMSQRCHDQSVSVPTTTALSTYCSFYQFAHCLPNTSLGAMPHHCMMPDICGCLCTGLCIYTSTCCL